MQNGFDAVRPLITPSPNDVRIAHAPLARRQIQFEPDFALSRHRSPVQVTLMLDLAVANDMEA